MALTANRPGRRRARALLFPLAVLCTSLAACGGDDTSTGTSATTGAGSAAETSAPAATDAGGDQADNAATDTRTITHRFGTTEVPAEPERIVAVGSTDADALAVLGVAPVGAYPNTGFGEGPYWPWLNELPELADTTALELDASYAVNIEQIASLRPDLILAVNEYSAPDAEQLYEQLSAVAPTVAASADPITQTWQDHALQIADALGRGDDMQAAIDEVDERIAEAAADNPAFQGTSLAFGGVFSPDAATMVFGERDYSRVFLGQLGFVVPPRQAAEMPALAGPQGEAVGQGPVSLERLDLLDADVLVLGYLDPAVAETFTDRDLFEQLPVVADGRYVEADAGVVAALRIPSVAGVPYVLDELVPAIAAVLE